MALPLETVVKQLEDSGIVAAGKLKDFIPPNASPKTGDELAQELVKSNLLTRFQAQHVAAGKTKSLILGGYTIIDKIGAGGMGQVFKALHRRMERVVAIKMLPPAVTKDAAAAARFQREVVAAAKLNHSHIVTAYDADQANGVHFLVMEYVEGKDLSATVKKDGPLPVAKAVNYILQAAKGLEFAHGEGVVHRDIKPGNLLLDKKGVVKILDMGLARIDAGDGPAQTDLTGTGAVMGTVDYMSPEQALNTKNADARADIYSLGCSLYFLLVGKAAYGGDTVMEKLLAHREDPIPSLASVQDDVPEQVQAVFRKMMAKKVADRYQTITDVVTDLEGCLACFSGLGAGSTVTRQSSGLTVAQSDLSIAFQHTPLPLIPSGFVDPPPERPKKRRTATKHGPPPPWKNRKVLLGAGAAGLLLMLLAAIVIKMQTKDGTLVIEVNQPDAIVQVLDPEGRVEISQPGGLEPVSISVAAGKHRIRVEKDGFVAIATDLEIQSGQSLPLRARLVPKPPEIGSAANASWKTPAFQAWVRTVVALPAEKQVEAVSKKLVELNPGFDGKVTGADLKTSPKIENGVVTAFGFCTDSVENISPVRALVMLRALTCGPSGAGKGRLSDLSPLQGLALWNLTCIHMPISDLSPLAGMPLKSLSCTDTNVSDLSPLKGMKLKSLLCQDSQVSDLSPLEGMNLIEVNFTPKNITKGLDAIRKMASLKVISISGQTKDRFTPAEFWKKYDAGEFGKPEAPSPQPSPTRGEGAKKKLAFLDPAFQAWMKSVQALPAVQQVEAVSQKLMELNPGFDGKVTRSIAGGMVTVFAFNSDNVTDISPVRALAGLKGLSCGGSNTDEGILSDLSPLAGASLTSLSCFHTPVSDLSPLRGMKLTSLNLLDTQVSDLSPLRGMPLASLCCYATPVTDLSPLEGMPLTNVDFHATHLSDLSPLRGMKLTSLMCYLTPVADLSPLDGMNLDEIRFTPQNIVKGLDVIRRMKSLKAIATGSDSKTNPAEFWKKYDAGEFGKSAAPAKLAYLDPAFQQWVKATQALPAEKQIEAVSKKLMELNPEFDGKLTGIDLRGTPKVENGVVTELRFHSMHVTDISPLRAFSKLNVLLCFPGGNAGSQLSDLSPLQGTPLAELRLSGTSVADLSPLEGMPLRTVQCDCTHVSDLSPLQECKRLRNVIVTKTKVTPAQVADLQKALPNCKIEWDDPAKPKTPEPAAGSK